MVILFLTSWGTTTLLSVTAAPLYIVSSKVSTVPVLPAYGCHCECEMVFQGCFDLGIHIFFQNMKGTCDSLPYIISCILSYSAMSTLLWPYSCGSLVLLLSLMCDETPYFWEAGDQVLYYLLNPWSPGI